MSEREFFSVVVRDARDRSTRSVAVTATAKPNPTTEVSTMQVDREKLARRLGLPRTADESMIRARLAGVEFAQQVRAAAPGPTPPRLDVANLQASSAAELRSLAASPLTSSDRDAVLEEISHRQLMASAYPGAAKSPDGRVRIHHAA